MQWNYIAACLERFIKGALMAAKTRWDGREWQPDELKQECRNMLQRMWSPNAEDVTVEHFLKTIHMIAIEYNESNTNLI